MKAQTTQLCPWLIEAPTGTFHARGRARFSEDFERPESFVYPGEDFTSDTLTWQHLGGDVWAVHATWEGEATHGPECFGVEGVITSIRAGLADHLQAFRIDSITWEAAPGLVDGAHVLASYDEVHVANGRPVAILTTFCGDKVERPERAFRAVFAGHFELAPWGKSERPERWHGEMRAEVVSTTAGAGGAA